LTASENNPRRPRKILLTGAAGFIGSNLAHWLLDNWSDVEIVSLDALTYAGNIANLDKAIGRLSVEIQESEVNQ